MTMRVLLVNSNLMKPAIAPIGLDYLSDSLAAAKHETQLLDLCFSPDIEADIESGIAGFRPDAIGVSVRNIDDCYFSSQEFFLPEIKSIMELMRRFSDAPVVLGGVGFSVAPKAVMEFCGADFGITGEGETAFVEFLDALQQRADFSRVPNLVYRDGEALRANPVVPVNLNRLPPRRRTLADNARYFSEGGQAGFETKRGCSMSCIYCADPVAKGRDIRLTPPDRVVGEISVLLARGIDHLHTCDSEFNLPVEHAREVCRAIINAGLGEKIRWYAYCAPTPFDEEFASVLKRAGCAGIDFGADSGCDEMLLRLGRHFTADDLADTAEICRKHSIPYMVDLLLGAPGETRATISKTIDFMRRIDADCVGLSIGVRVYRGTPMAGVVEAEGGPAGNPNLFGAKSDKPSLLKPVFYLPPQLGEGIVSYVRELVAGDPRFFLPTDSAANSNYNYNANTVLVQAIKNGARGAYWDILRRMRPPS